VEEILSPPLSISLKLGTDTFASGLATSISERRTHTFTLRSQEDESELFAEND
jgi:hypothetical protein